MSAIERAEDEQGDVGVADEDDHRPQATVAAASASVQPGGEPAVNGIASEEIPAVSVLQCMLWSMYSVRTLCHYVIRWQVVVVYHIYHVLLLRAYYK